MESQVLYKKQSSNAAANNASRGGIALSQALGVSSIQAKLAINQPNDVYEQEADKMAENVMRMEEPGIQTSPFRVSSLQRKCAECEKEDRLMQRKETGTREAEADSSLENYIGGLSAGGKSLPDEVRNFYEPRFGYDFSNVRVHTDAVATKSAQSINALAYTNGNNIVFNEGQYSPENDTGKRLLAHELTHVVQQGQVQQKTGIQRTIGDGHDLKSPRMATNERFQAIFDKQDLMKDGDKGPEVRHLQEMLTDLGISLPGFGADGIFGAETVHAVKEYQGRKGLSKDGRVGPDTITALDNDFPAFTKPANISDPWTMPCILGLLCPWNKHLVESVLPTFNIITFDSRTFPTETFDGTSWNAGTFTSGGFTNGKDMGFLNTTTCEKLAFVIYHEGWHGQQPAGMTGVVEAETDAYVNAEQWSIDTGLKGQGTFTNANTGTTDSLRTTKGGETVVNEPAAKQFVKQEYGGVSSVPGERVLARVGATDVRVRKPDGTEYVRPAKAGESVRGAVSMTNLHPINPADWVCP